MGCVPLPMTLADGREVIFVGRGGGHSPPEKPEGISMVSADDGETIWTLPLKKFMSTMTFNVHGDHVLVFHVGEHLWVDAMTGKITKRVSIIDDVPVHGLNEETFVRETTRETIDIGKKTRAIIQQSNVLAGNYHYFRAYTKPWIGRVDVVSGNVEYLQLAIQVQGPGNNRDFLWSQSGMSEEVVASQIASMKKPPKEVTGSAHRV